METPPPPSKAQLEASKERLGTALRTLQQAVERKLQLMAALTQENSALTRQLEQLSQEHTSLKNASNTAFAQLNQSIDQLETLIGDTNEKCP